MWNNIKNYLRNIWVFRRTLAKYRPWDYSGMLMAMHDALQDMEESQRKSGIHLDSDKSCDKMRVYMFALNRIIEDNYVVDKYDYSLEFKDNDEFEIGIVKKWDLPSLRASSTVVDYLEKQDLRIVGELFKKGHIKRFWD